MRMLCGYFLKRVRKPALVMAVILVLTSPLLAGTIVADYTTLATGTSASVVLNGTTVTGTSSVVSISGLGLGILGGGDNSSLDLGETMTVNFSQLVTNVTLTAQDINPPGNVTYAFTAFNGATNVGIFSIPLHVSEIQTHDLTTLSFGTPFSSFTLSLSASAPLGLRIRAVSYDVAATAVPEPASFALLSIGVISMAGYGWIKRKSRAA